MSDSKNALQKQQLEIADLRQKVGEQDRILQEVLPLLPLLESFRHRQAQGVVDGEDGFSAIEAMSHEGPIPPPGQLREYAELFPDFVEGMLSNYNNESLHRRQLEMSDQKVAQRVWNHMMWHMWACYVSATLISGTILYLAFLLIQKEASGPAVAMVGALTVVGVFLAARSKAGRDKPREQEPASESDG